MSLHSCAHQQEITSSFPGNGIPDEHVLAFLQERAEVFWEVTSLGEMQEVCSSWQNFTGQGERESLGRGWFSALHPADQSRVAGMLLQTATTGQTEERVCRIRKNNSAYHPVRVRAMPMSSHDGTIGNIIMCGNSISVSQLPQAMSDAQVQLALTVSGVGMWDWDLLTNQLTWTAEERALFGFAPETPVTYERFLTALHPDDRIRVPQLHTHALATKTEYRMEYRTIWPDGSIHWLADRARGMYDGQGHPVHMVGATIDITSIKQTEEALRESELRFRRLVESNIIGIILTDLEGNIHEANEAFLSLVGYTQEDVAARRMQWTTMTPPEYRIRDAQAIEDLRTIGVAQPFEKEYVAKDGRRVPVLIGGAHLRWDGPSQLIIVFVVDLTARKELERQKDLMLSLTGHELKTPLAALKGTFQLLQRRVKRLVSKGDQVSPEVSTFLADLSERLTVSIRQVDAQTHVINDLLDVSRITVQTLKLELGHYDLIALIREAVEAMRLIEPERSLLLTLPEHTEVPVHVDAVRIMQVVTNYVTNAMRYSSPDQPVQIGLTVQEKSACVWVRDKGPGLSVEAQKKLWQRFSQVKEVPVRSGLGKGLGLGLYICQTLITQHRGEVGVESAPGKGSTFWFTLPIAK